MYILGSCCLFTKFLRKGASSCEQGKISLVRLFNEAKFELKYYNIPFSFFKLQGMHFLELLLYALSFQAFSFTLQLKFSTFYAASHSCWTRCISFCVTCSVHTSVVYTSPNHSDRLQKGDVPSSLTMSVHLI